MKVWLLENEQARWFEFEEPHDMPDDVTVTMLTETEQQHLESALFQAQTAAIGLAHKVKMYEDALGEIACSNNSEWQHDRAMQVLAQMRGVEI